MRGAADLGKRLARAEVALLLLPGCPTCRVWSETVVGDDAGRRSRSEACPSCGRRVPVIVAGIDLDLV